MVFIKIELQLSFISQKKQSCTYGQAALERLAEEAHNLSALQVPCCNKSLRASLSI